MKKKELAELALLLICVYAAIISLAIYMIIFNPVIRENPFLFIMVLVSVILVAIVGIGAVYALRTSHGKDQDYKELESHENEY